MDRRLDRCDKDLAVADLAGVGRSPDGVDGLIGQHDFELHLGHVGHRVFGAAIDLRVPPLAPEALDLAHGHPLYAQLRQGRAHNFELEWLNDRGDELHGNLPLPGAGPPSSIKA